MNYWIFGIAAAIVIDSIILISCYIANNKHG